MSIKTLRYGKDEHFYTYLLHKQFSKKIEIRINPFDDIIWHYDTTIIYEKNNGKATLYRIVIDNQILDINDLQKGIYKYWKKKIFREHFKRMQKDIYHTINRIVNKVELFLETKNIEC